MGVGMLKSYSRGALDGAAVGWGWRSPHFRLVKLKGETSGGNSNRLAESRYSERGIGSTIG